MYVSADPLTKEPPFNPNPPDVRVIARMNSHPQSEHFSLNSMVDFPDSDSNIFRSISIKSPSKGG